MVRSGVKIKFPVFRESELRPGVLVKVKSAEWYQEHCDTFGRVRCQGNTFTKDMICSLGRTGTIIRMDDSMSKDHPSYEVLFADKEVNEATAIYMYTADMFDNVILDIAR